LQDPLDKKYVILKTSRAFPNASTTEGAFASKDVPSQTVYSLYGGLLITKEEGNELSAKLKETNDAKAIERGHMYT